MASSRAPAFTLPPPSSALGSPGPLSAVSRASAAAGTAASPSRIGSPGSTMRGALSFPATPAGSMTGNSAQTSPARSTVPAPSPLGKRDPSAATMLVAAADPSLSDNSDEELDVMVYDTKTVDTATGKTAYLDAVAEAGGTPVSNFLDKIGDMVVNLRHHGLRQDEFEPMTRALAINKFIQTLDFGHNNLGLTGATLLANALGSNVTLTSLNVDNTSITTAGGIELVSVLQSSAVPLKHLSMGENKLGDKFVQALVKVLTPRCKLVSLSLHNCDITGAGAAQLGVAIDANPYMRELNLAWNRIRGDGGVQCVASLASSRLTSLDLSFNRFEDDVGVCIGSAMGVQRALTTLDLSYNSLTEPSGLALAKALSENSTLQALRVGFNDLGLKATMSMLSALESNETLAVLGLENCYAGQSSGPPEELKMAETEAKLGRPVIKPSPLVTVRDHARRICERRPKLIRIKLEYPET